MAAAALPTDLHKSAPELTELPGLKDASFPPELGVLWGQPALGVTPIEGTLGKKQRETGAFLEGKSKHSHPSCLLP